MKWSAFMLLCCALLAVPAAATSIPISFSTTGLGPLSFQADTFSLAGQTGILTLDTAMPTNANINIATFSVGDSGSFSGSQALTLTYNLTLGGVTNALSQTATWTITPAVDSFFTMAASSPVLFATPFGNWNVTLNASSFRATVFVQQTAPTSANFAPVPEPATLVLCCTGLMLGVFLRKRIICDGSRGRLPT